MGEHQLFLCLGGNLGNKAEIFAETVLHIRQLIGHPEKISALYVSPAWGFVSENDFWNQVLLVTTSLTPRGVLGEIGIIENHFGRERKAGGYCSRKMDIDILFYDNLVLETGELTIPHPLIPLRNFVLVPLAEIAPEFVHPVTGETIAEMRSKCPDSSIICPVEIPE